MEKVEIKEIRDKLGLTQAEFAEVLGVQRTYVSMVESGKKPLSDKFIKKVDKLLKKEVYTKEDTQVDLVAIDARISGIEKRLESIERLLIQLLAK